MDFGLDPNDNQGIYKPFAHSIYSEKITLLN